MRVLVVEPERRPEVREINDSYDAMEYVVGGPIQSSFPFDDSVVLMRNGANGLAGLLANRGLKDKEGCLYDIVFGTFLLCGTPTDSGHFTSLTLEQVERYREQFYTPEMFWGVDGRIVCIPYEGGGFNDG